MTPRKSVSVARLDDNGNGKVYVSINLKLIHWLLTMVGLVVVISTAMFAMMRATIPILIDPAISSWMETHHLPVHTTEYKELAAKIGTVDMKVENNRTERQIEIGNLQADVTEVKLDVKDIRAYLLGRK